MDKRLSKARRDLRLSHDYVARTTGIGMARLIAMEAGLVQPDSAELTRLSELYGIPSENLRHGNIPTQEETKIMDGFKSQLSDVDKNEIRRLIRFRDSLRKGKGYA